MAPTVIYLPAGVPTDATLLTPNEVARRLSVQPATLRRAWPRWHRNNDFPAPIRIGRRLRWNVAALDRWLSRAPLPAVVIGEPDWDQILGERIDEELAAIQKRRRRPQRPQS